MAQVKVLVGTRKGAWIYTSDEKRERWEISDPIFPGWTVYHMDIDQRRNPPRMYAAANHWAWGRSVARSDDMGKTWEQRSPSLAFPKDMGISVGNVWLVKPGHRSQPGVVFAGTQPGGLFRSDDWGESWESVDSLNRHKYRQFWNPTGGGDSCIHSIEVDPRDPNRMYAAVSSGGTYVTEDGGKSWDLCSHGIVVTTPAAKEFLAQIAEAFPQPKVPEDVDPAALDEFHKFVIDPKNPDRLWGQSHVGVFKSEHRGKDWQDVTSGLPSFHGFPIAVTKRDPDAVFVVPIEYGADNFRVVRSQFAVWRTMDQGKTWQQLTRGLPGPNNFQSAYRESMDTDGLDSEGVYVGTTNGHVYASRDLGENWTQLPGTLPPILGVTVAVLP
ncbi:MAG TPA: exo-alpha-sialidase [Dehalococcoidia bacterium]|nr:exo-alpha-sialidase [Dehalococcoidia bacterium]